MEGWKDCSHRTIIQPSKVQHTQAPVTQGIALLQHPLRCPSANLPAFPLSASRGTPTLHLVYFDALFYFFNLIFKFLPPGRTGETATQRTSLFSINIPDLLVSHEYFTK
jgi:hypothetical protein